MPELSGLNHNQTCCIYRLCVSFTKLLSHNIKTSCLILCQKVPNCSNSWGSGVGPLRALYPMGWMEGTLSQPILQISSWSEFWCQVSSLSYWLLNCSKAFYLLAAIVWDLHWHHIYACTTFSLAEHCNVMRSYYSLGPVSGFNLGGWSWLINVCSC